jgi:hypothetical protein
MEGASPFEISVAIYRYTRRHKQDQLNVHQHQCEKLILRGTGFENCGPRSSKYQG